MAIFKGSDLFIREKTDTTWYAEEWFEEDEMVWHNDGLFVCQKDHYSDHHMQPNLATDYWEWVGRRYNDYSE